MTAFMLLSRTYRSTSCMIHFGMAKAGSNATSWRTRVP